MHLHQPYCPRSVQARASCWQWAPGEQLAFQHWTDEASEDRDVCPKPILQRWQSPPWTQVGIKVTIWKTKSNDSFGGGVCILAPCHPSFPSVSDRGQVLARAWASRSQMRCWGLPDNGDPPHHPQDGTSEGRDSDQGPGTLVPLALPHVSPRPVSSVPAKILSCPHSLLCASSCPSEDS